jgi:outer membrane receptor protein involved in Fe transport
LQKPLSPKDKGLVNLQYKTENKKWSFDVTAKLYGINRIPSTGIINNGYEIPASSQAYTLYNSQITYSLKSFDVYLGAENISDYRQSNAIIAANEPFGNSFDASLIWGPLMGRTVYVGFRYSIK